MGIRAVLYFTLTTVFAVTLGLVVSTAVKDILPLIKIDADNAAAEAGVNNMTFMEQIVNMFPSNLIEPISSMTMIQIIVIALFFGVAMVHVGEKGEMAKKVTLSFNEVVGKILSYIIAVAPYGVFCMLTPVVVTNGPGVLGSYAALVVLGYSCFILHALCVYAPLVCFLGGLSPLKFFRGMQSAMFVCFLQRLVGGHPTLFHEMYRGARCTQGYRQLRSFSGSHYQHGRCSDLSEFHVGIHGRLLWH